MGKTNDMFPETGWVTLYLFSGDGQVWRKKHHHTIITV